MNIYEETLEKLHALSEDDFKKFCENVIAGKKPLIGVRTESIKKIAKETALIDLYGYLSRCEFKYYEDTLVYGLLISKLNGDEFFEYLEVYLNNCDSWAHIDIFVPEIKFAKRDKAPLMRYIEDCDGKADGFKLRFATVALMDYFLNSERLDYIFAYAVRNDGKGYYNDMAIAWLISAAYIKFEERTYEFLKKRVLSEFTYRKTLSKIVDSKRVKDKEKIKKLRTEK